MVTIVNCHVSQYLPTYHDNSSNVSWHNDCSTGDNLLVQLKHEMTIHIVPIFLVTIHRRLDNWSRTEVMFISRHFLFFLRARLFLLGFKSWKCITNLFWTNFTNISYLIKIWQSKSTSRNAKQNEVGKTCDSV